MHRDLGVLDARIEEQHRAGNGLGNGLNEVKALAADDLSTKGLVAMEDFLRNVPGVVLNSASEGFNRIAMRGLINTVLGIDRVQDRSLVAMYLDDIPIGLNMSNPELRAVEHNGRVPDRQLLDGLSLIEREIGEMTENLARGDLDKLAAHGRYLELKYAEMKEIGGN